MVQYSVFQRHHADVLLVTVTEVETMAVQNVFSGTNKHFIGDKTYYDLGEVGEVKVSLVQSEMGAGGQGGAIRTVEKGIEIFSPSAVVMVGIAFGTNQKKQQIGGILVSERILDYDLQKISAGSNNELVIIPRGDKVSASPRLLNRFRDGAMEWKRANETAKVEFGLILSGSKLVAHQDFRKQLQEFGPEAIGGEMEGAGLYAAAQGNKVDWILVKAICDWADGNKDDTYQQLAADNVAHFIKYVIQQGGLRSQQMPVPPNIPPVGGQPSVQVADQPASAEAATLLKRKIDANDFDVFVCYNSVDRAEVKRIGLALKSRGILPWLDEWELIPGQPWQRALEQQIRTIKSAAVFVGPTGMGPWHRSEMDAILRQVKRRDCPVIPVLLPGITKEPDLPVFLEEMSWVDFGKEEPDPMEQLLRGITGKHGNTG